METNDLVDSGNVSASDIALLFVVSEKNAGDGMLTFNSSDLWVSFNETIQGLIFDELTEGKLATGHKGAASLFISANGTAAQSGYPEPGKSAVSMILPALTAVDSWTRCHLKKGDCRAVPDSVTPPPAWAL